MDTDQIKKTLDSGSGASLKLYLISKLEELKSIDNIKDKDVATHLAIEVKGQKKAYLKLKEILQEIMSFTVEVKPKDKRDSYGINDEDII